MWCLIFKQDMWLQRLRAYQDGSYNLEMVREQEEQMDFCYIEWVSNFSFQWKILCEHHHSLSSMLMFPVSRGLEQGGFYCYLCQCFSNYFSKIFTSVNEIAFLMPTYDVTASSIFMLECFVNVPVHSHSCDRIYWLRVPHYDTQIWPRGC